jgi:hypothetical protein
MEEITNLKQQVQELLDWKAAREHIFISNPLDDISKINIGAAIGNGLGSKTKTQSVAVASTPTNITVPAAYTGTVLLVIGGTTYEVPYL